MATFPAIYASSPRTRSLSSYPTATHGATIGAFTTVRQNGREGVEPIQLEFSGLTTAELQLIWDHYKAQRGSLVPFDLSPEVIAGVDTPENYTPANYGWIYAPEEPIRVVDWSVLPDETTGIHDVTLTLVMVAEPSTGAAAVVQFAVVDSGGATTESSGGVPPDLTITATLATNGASGTAVADAAAATATATTTAGDATVPLTAVASGTSINAAATVSTGEANGSAAAGGISVSATATTSPGDAAGAAAAAAATVNGTGTDSPGDATV